MIVGVAVLAAVIRFWKGSDAVFDDSDLQPVRIVVPEKENAFPLLEEAAALLRWPSDAGENAGASGRNEGWDGRRAEKLMLGEAWDDDFVAQLLDQNQRSLDLLQQALQRPRLQVPPAGHWDEERPHLAHWKDLNQLVLIRARKLFREGRQEDAFEVAFSMVQLGYRMQDAGGPVIDYLVGAGVKLRSLIRLQAMVTESALHSDELRTWIKTVESCGANYSGLTNALRWEYDLAIGMAKDNQAGKFSRLDADSDDLPSWLPVGHLMVNLAKTRKLVAHRTRECLRDIPLCFSEMTLTERDFPDDAVGMFRMALGGNMLGELMFDMMSPLSMRLLAKKCQEDAYLSLTQTLLALKCYHSERGHLPESLSELVPRYLESVPVDDFDDQPLRYSRERKVLYSVGRDLTDDGGKEAEKDREGSDLVVKIEF